MRPLLLGMALLSAWLATPGRATALTVQEAILLAKPAVALITAEVRAEVSMNCGTGPVTVEPRPFVETGTGWFVDGRGYLITNAHVVDPVYRLPAWVLHELKKTAIDEACVYPVLRERGLAPGQRPEVDDQLRRSASDRALASAKVTPTATITVRLSSGDKLPAEVMKFSPPIGLDSRGDPVKESGRDLALLRVKDGVYPALAPTPRDIQIGDPVHILGFPGVVLTHELLSKSAAIEASVNNGTVSGFQKDAIGQDIIQSDASAAHGNSGGPATGDDAAVIGVLTFVSQSASGDIVQGFNFLIPARDVLKFLKGTDVDPGKSRFNEIWMSGLDAFFAERYSTAVARLTEANRLIPNLPDVKRTMAEAEKYLKNPRPRPFPWAWATLGVTLLSVGAYGGMFGRRWWKNRFRIMPTQVITFIEKGLNPVMLDVRTNTDFETSPLKLPGAVRLVPDEAMAGRVNLDFDPKQIIVAYCTSPEEATSTRIVQLLHQRGFKNARILKGGLGGWTNARLPVESKASLPSIGLEIYKNLTLGDVERRRFKPQEVICKQGSDARGEAYLIHSGTIEVRKVIDGTLRVLATLGEGELVGEIALFRNATRSADMVAVTDTELLVIKNERLDWLIRNRPQLTAELLKRLSEIVVATDAERGHPALR